MFSGVPKVGCCSWQNVSNRLKFAESNELPGVGAALRLQFQRLLGV